MPMTLPFLAQGKSSAWTSDQDTVLPTYSLSPLSYLSSESLVIEKGILQVSALTALHPKQQWDGGPRQCFLDSSESLSLEISALLGWVHTACRSFFLKVNRIFSFFSKPTSCTFDKERSPKQTLMAANSSASHTPGDL